MGMVMQRRMKKNSVSRLKTRKKPKSGDGDLVVERELQSYDRVSCDFCCGVLSRAAPRGLGGGGTWFGIPLLPSPRADGPPAIVLVRAPPLGAGVDAREEPDEELPEPAAWGDRRDRAEPGVAEGGV